MGFKCKSASGEACASVIRIFGHFEVGMLGEFFQYVWSCTNAAFCLCTTSAIAGEKIG